MQKIVPLSSYANSGKKQKRAYAFVKRSFDIVVSLVALLLLSSLFLVVSVIAAIDTKGKPLFIQQRMGKGNVPFMVFKFRTMNVAAPREVATHKLENPDQYISRVGETLRKLSIDELPQLINVLIGNMSIVGPRPVVLTETDLIALRGRNGANLVRPGITGLAQISGRDNVTIAQKAWLDGEYAAKCSVGMDLKILFKSVGYVLGSKGICEGANPRISSCKEKTERSA